MYRDKYSKYGISKYKFSDEFDTDTSNNIDDFKDNNSNTMYKNKPPINNTCGSEKELK